MHTLNKTFLFFKIFIKGQTHPFNMLRNNKRHTIPFHLIPNQSFCVHPKSLSHETYFPSLMQDMTLLVWLYKCEQWNHAHDSNLSYCAPNYKTAWIRSAPLLNHQLTILSVVSWFLSSFAKDCLMKNETVSSILLSAIRIRIRFKSKFSYTRSFLWYLGAQQ